MAFCMFCALTNAQNNMSSSLDQLAIQCQQVIELNDTINARQARLDELKSLLEDLKLNWLQTCNQVISSPECDDNETRINTLNELIRLTHPKFESGLLAQLKEARNNSAIRFFSPDSRPLTPSRQERKGQRTSTKKEYTSQPGQNTPSNPKTTTNPSESDKTKKEDVEVVNPITEDRTKDNKSTKKDESATSPLSKDSKKDNPRKQGSPTKKDENDNKDKTKIEESKDQSNRNKTIELMNKTKNQNK